MNQIRSDLRDTLQNDLYRYCGKTSRSAFIGAYLRKPGFRFTFHLRKAAFYSTRKKSMRIVSYLLHRMVLDHYRLKYGFDIPYTTRIGPGLYLGHFGGVVIHGGAVLGANINIGQGVTIGIVNRGPHSGVPTLEDRVWVGAHAILVGRITIGHDALIAPGAYVNFDVPCMGVVLGNPGKLVSHAGSAGYVNNVLGGAESAPVPGVEWLKDQSQKNEPDGNGAE
jgi:serine O-acetyltransferase